MPAVTAARAARSAFARHVYRVVSENAHGERYFEDDTTNAAEAMRMARVAIERGRGNVRVEVAPIAAQETA